MIYTHDGGVEAIGDDMRRVLSAEFGRHLNIDLYNGKPKKAHTVSTPIYNKVSPKETPKKKAHPDIEDVEAVEVKPTEVKPEQKVSSRADEIETSGNAVPENDNPDGYDPKLMMYNLFGELVEIPGAKKRRNMRQGLPKEQKQPQQPQKSQPKSVEVKAADATPQATTIKAETPLLDTPKTGFRPLSKEELELYGSLNWDDNPPINGFYTTMMEIAHRQLMEQEAERQRLEKMNNPDIPDTPYIEMTEGDFIPGVSTGVKKRTIIPIDDVAADSQKKEPDMTPRPFSEDIQFFHKDGSMVCDNGQVGFLSQVSRMGATFKPLQLKPEQEKRAMLYITLSETYQRLYHYEAETHEASEHLREHLNQYYDEFVEKYGHLNERANVKFIKMDANGCDALALERGDNGLFVKADIFDRPVAFAVDELTSVGTPMEALSASLNKFGKVDFPYMCSLVGMDREQMIESLDGRIYYNPLISEYEISDRFIAGNVVTKAEMIESWITDTGDTDPRVAASLKALKDAFPERIRFEELDFNFGERWIPSGIYAEYMSYLYETDVKIAYSSAMDTFSATNAQGNAKIWHEYCVKGQFKRYDGMSLLRHALHNTTPDIKKSIGKDADGKDILVPDPEAIQLANTKIDEIRDGFTEWLNAQSDEFKDRLVDLYNRRFNCFVRPRYDGSHQTFPDINMKMLGDSLDIKSIYQSQKDCIWMLLQNGGGIADHEVLRP